MSNASPLVTKKALGLAGIAAFGACAACCALPLLAAAGIGGGALSAVAGRLRPGADLVVASGVGAFVLAVIAFRGRARRSAACDVACDAGAGCGCGPVDKSKIVWETTASKEAARVLDEFARLPERLNQYARGSEVAPIKQAIGDAGLIFAADAPGSK